MYRGYLQLGAVHRQQEKAAEPFKRHNESYIYHLVHLGVTQTDLSSRHFRKVGYAGARKKNVAQAYIYH